MNMLTGNNRARAGWEAEGTSPPGEAIAAGVAKGRAHIRACDRPLASNVPASMSAEVYKSMSPNARKKLKQKQRAKLGGVLSGMSETTENWQRCRFCQYDRHTERQKG